MAIDLGGLGKPAGDYFPCGNEPPQYTHLCAESCQKYGGDIVLANKNHNYSDPMAFPDVWNEWFPNSPASAFQEAVVVRDAAAGPKYKQALAAPTSSSSAPPSAQKETEDYTTYIVIPGLSSDAAPDANEIQNPNKQTSAPLTKGTSTSASRNQGTLLPSPSRRRTSSKTTPPSLVSSSNPGSSTRSPNTSASGFQASADSSANPFASSISSAASSLSANSAQSILPANKTLGHAWGPTALPHSNGMLETNPTSDRGRMCPDICSSQLIIRASFVLHSRFRNGRAHRPSLSDSGLSPCNMDHRLVRYDLADNVKGQKGHTGAGQCGLVN